MITQQILSVAFDSNFDKHEYWAHLHHLESEVSSSPEEKKAHLDAKRAHFKAARTLHKYREAKTHALLASRKANNGREILKSNPSNPSSLWKV